MKTYNSTLKKIIVDGAERGGDKRQFIFGGEDGNEIEYSFREVREDEIRFGSYLFAKGLAGKKIAILGENSYEWIVSYYAVIAGGCVCVPLDPRLTPAELASQLADCGCDTVITTGEYYGTAEEIGTYPDVNIRLIIDTRKLKEILDEGAAADEAIRTAYIESPVSPDDLACIVYTSGTTGKTKGVMLSHRNVAANVLACCERTDGGHALGFLPLNHTYSWVAGLFAGLVKSEWGSICTSISHLYKDIKKYSPTNFAAVPLAVEMIQQKIVSSAKRRGNYEQLLDGLKFSEDAMKAGLDMRRSMFSDVHDSLGGELEFIMCGGAYLDPEIERFMYNLGIQIVTGYGLTECSPCVTVTSKRDFKFGSAGTPIDCCEISIHDPDETGTGEIYVRGENVMMGYYGDEAATASVFDGEWLKTGDLGYIDEEGFLFFRGRKKNLIILSNGKNVSPEEIEEKFSGIEYVKEVLVYGENGRITGEFFLDTELFPDCEELLAKDVEKINETLGEYKKIQKIKTRDTEFPKTTSLKIIRKYD